MALTGKFGAQPGLKVLQDERWPVRRVAREIGVAEHQLRNALHGRNRVHPDIIQRLPDFLGVELSALFTDEILAVPFDPRRGVAVGARR